MGRNKSYKHTELTKLNRQMIDAIREMQGLAPLYGELSSDKEDLLHGPRKKRGNNDPQNSTS